jgi:aspartate/glutamate racemase
MLEPTKKLIAENLSGVNLINIVDDSLIQEVISSGGITPGIKRRLINYYYSAIDAGADIIFNTCSSVGDIAIAAREIIPIPIVKIDDAMAHQAIDEANRIGVLATLSSTLDPTIRLLQSFAQDQNTDVSLVDGLADGAFQAIIAGNAAKHDALILETAERIVEQVDIFVLAQGSMARMAEELSRKTGKKVLSSPLLGVLNLKEYL